MTIVWSTAQQGSSEWLDARRGVITGSRFKDARDFTAKGLSTAKRDGYAMDLAREREGGIVPPIFQNSAMKTGTEQEPIARMKYEARTGELVEEAGFACTIDRKFGCSPDGLIGTEGAFETKAMVSSATLFKALVDGDISEYRDQCIGYQWLLNVKWVDLALWCPDLDALHVIRIPRDEDAVQALEDDMLKFDALVESYRAKLRAKLAPAAPAATPAAPNMDAPWDLPATPIDAPAPAAKRALAAANF